MEIQSHSKDTDTQLALLNRLIDLEPSWENLSLRASTREKAGLHYLAIQDAFAALNRAGTTVNPFVSTTSPTVEMSQNGNLPPEQYELALRWEQIRHAGEQKASRQQRALLLYRLGRYSDTLAELQHEEEESLPQKIGNAVLIAASGSIINEITFRLCVQCVISNLDRKNLHNSF
jgi:hypothetical protein